jgi:flagellar biosynthesis/type III secretory pathway protein FliH
MNLSPGVGFGRRREREGTSEGKREGMREGMREGENEGGEKRRQRRREIFGLARCTQASAWLALHGI